MLKRGQSKAKLFMAVGIVILFALGLLGLLFVIYITGPDYNISVDGEIKEISFKGDSAFIKLKGGINDGNISEVKFIFRDENGEEYVYSTSEGASDISVEFDRDFFDWLMRKDKLKGQYDYVVSVSEVEGLNNFDGVVEVSVSFEYETPSGEIVDTKPVDVKKVVTKKVIGGGSNSGGNSGGGSSGGGGSGVSGVGGTTNPPGQTGCSGCTNCDEWWAWDECDYSKCKNECGGGCYFVGKIAGDENCISAVDSCLGINFCSDYSNYECDNDLCLKNCEFKGGNCVEKVVLKADIITQQNITWYFDKEYEYGQYANGDYWVVGPVIITDVTPPGIENGAEANPIDTFYQGVLNNYSNYDARRNIMESLPYTANPGESIIKIDRKDNPDGCGTSAIKINGCVETASVLTVVENKIEDSENMFRPPFYGTNKTPYYVDRIKWGRLPEIPEVSARIKKEGYNLTSKADAWNVPYYAIKHGPGMGEFFRALIIHKYFTNGYGATVSISYDTDVLFTFGNNSIDEKRDLVISLMQKGIDMYELYKLNFSFSSGAGQHYGAKPMIVYFASLYDDESILKDVQSIAHNPDKRGYYQEDAQIFVGVDNKTVLWGDGSCERFFRERDLTGLEYHENRYWSGYLSEWNARYRGGGGYDNQGTACDPYGYLDGPGGGPDPTNPSGRTYQGLSGPHIAFAFLQHLMPWMEYVNNHSELLSYSDRYFRGYGFDNFNGGFWSIPDECAPVNDSESLSCNPWLGGKDCIYYKVTWGPDPSNPGECIKHNKDPYTNGRWVELHDFGPDYPGYLGWDVMNLWDQLRVCSDPLNETYPCGGLGCLVGDRCLGEDIYYIRADANGSNTGRDWENAFTTFPYHIGANNYRYTDLVRGATYYVADGNYSEAGYHFKELENGEYVVIKKATKGEHGTNLGWEDSYGDGQALFNAITLEASYYVFDGVTGGGPYTWDFGHGFKIKADGGRAVDFRGPNWYEEDVPDHINITHVEIENRGIAIPDVSDTGIYAGCVSCGNGSHEVYLAYNYMHDFSRNAILTSGVYDWVFEYNYVSRQTATGTTHGEGWQDFGGDNMIIRNNVFSDLSSTAYIALKKNYGAENNNWSIYGNVFMCNDEFNYGVGGNGVIGVSDETQAPVNNMRVYNNAFINLRGSNVGIRFNYGENNTIYNNIWFNNIAHLIQLDGYTVGDGCKHDYNWFFNNTRGPPQTELEDWCNSNYCNLDVGYLDKVGLVDSEENAVLGENDPFIDWRNMDFRLKYEIPGFSLGEGYNEDVFGNVRGGDGVWDRGAVEYTEEVLSSSSNIFLRLLNWLKNL